jgi:hypothetical protein
MLQRRHADEHAWKGKSPEPFGALGAHSSGLILLLWNRIKVL